MNAEQWKDGRRTAGLTQVKAATALGVSQPYLSQLEKGLRKAGWDLTRKATRLYGLSPALLPVRDSRRLKSGRNGDLQRQLASLGYPGFEHIRARVLSNPAEIVFRVVNEPDLDTRLVEAVPWVLAAYPDLDWEWLRDQVKLRNVQNRLGYLIHLATETAVMQTDRADAVRILSRWQRELDEARLVREGTLCRESMPSAERAWVATNRPPAAAHWRVLTTLTAGELPYAAPYAAQ
jgi:transcriptional regulator with XRE-family HTH domain